MMKMAVKAVVPFLGKITEGLDAMAKEFGVSECFLIIRKRQIANDKGTLEWKPILVLMGPTPDGSGLMVLTTKDGQPAEYPIEKLVDLISGNKMEEEDED